MSLVTSASPWSNEETPKKRIPSMRKTAKKLSPVSINSIGLPDNYISTEEVYQDSQDNQDQGPTQSQNSLNDVQAAQEDRSNRVNQLLNQMEFSSAGDNDGNKLANFKPLSHPIIQKRTDNADTNIQGKVADNFIPNAENPLQIPPPKIRQDPGGSNYSPNGPNSDLGNLNTRPYSNYRMIYEPAKMMIPNGQNGPYYGQNGQVPLDNRLLEKINYMVHMLEQQHNEKTSNITEEFVLYTFLGVFIIFIVDSFSRSGKYTR